MISNGQLEIIKRYIDTNPKLKVFSFYPLFKKKWFEKMDLSVVNNQMFIYSTKPDLLYYEYHNQVMGYDMAFNLSIDMIL